MFFFFSKTISALIYPPTWMAFLLIWALFSKKNRKKIIIAILCLVFVYGNTVLSNLAVRFWEWKCIPIADVEKHDLAVVLTGVTAESKDPERVFFSRGADRITHAFQLWKLGKVEKVLITGGKGGINEKQHEMEEALKLKNFLVMCGMPDSLILTEIKAKNTFENAKFTKEIIDQLPEKPEKILLITSSFHMRRSMACFKKQGLTTKPFPVDFYGTNQIYEEQYLPFPNAGSMSKFDMLMKEIFGFLAYKITGKI